ncbi:unnamed protein product [Cylindrotheca closterium]|uniref:Methyltransferase domain-containing protein n=1 Tax=Cylindrotheca closterium TaxID=2856 RepID=A0AAD2CFQ4_9STRA|nr:unnamed protein product [Cylindrotheca closterium]
MSLNLLLCSEPTDSNFGRRDYWNEVYQKESNYSWYAGWEELEPFCNEFFEMDYRILIPGVGNDAALVGMYDAGYHHLTAMDYAPEGIERCRDMLGSQRILQSSEEEKDDDDGVKLLVADARDLKGVLQDDSFDGILEKGTLDAIFLSGGKDKEEANKNMELAIEELTRCLRPGGIFMSITAVVVGQIQAAFDSRQDQWECIVDEDSIYTTEDGFTSNNIDGNMLVWKKRITEKS